MAIDERRLDELIVESQDQQADALRDARSVLPDLPRRPGRRWVSHSRPEPVERRS